MGRMVPAKRQHGKPRGGLPLLKGGRMDASVLGLLDELLDAAVEVGGVAAVLAGHVGAVGGVAC